MSLTSKVLKKNLRSMKCVLFYFSNFKLKTKKKILKFKNIFKLIDLLLVIFPISYVLYILIKLEIKVL